MMTGTDLIKVSIIVPVYNTAKYLPQCLDSILSQTMPNFEVICVDDGSTDDSLKILYEYAAKDGRVRVVQQDNMTAGAARNRGMDLAVGEYLLFLDSDDFFSERLIETAYGIAKQYDADITLFGADIFNNATQEYQNASWYVREELLPIEQPFSANDIPLDILQITTPAPWNKLFRRSFMERENLRFQALPNTNDTYCVIAALLLAPKIAYTTDTLVTYRRGQSDSTQERRNEAPRCFFEALNAIDEMMRQRGIRGTFEKAFSEFARDILKYNFSAIDFKVLPISKRVEMEKHFGLNSIYSLDMDERCAGVKITVAVPVYNTAPYLKKCMDSIVKQSYSNLEIICVNDCSTDQSLEILKEYAAKDTRIKIIDKQQNEMTMLARMSAVEAATGDYIVFIDSDDYFSKDAMATIAQAIYAYRTDIVHFSSGIEMDKPDEQYESYFLLNNNPKNEKSRGVDYLKQTFITREISTSPCGRAYKADVIKHAYSLLPKECVKVGEDVFAMFFVALYTRSYAGIATNPLYIYRHGLGISNFDTMPDEKFELYCDMGKLAQWATDFLIERKVTQVQLDALNAMSRRMLEDVLRIIEQGRIPPEKVHTAELAVARNWCGITGANEVIERKLGKNIASLMGELKQIPVYTKLSRDRETAKGIPCVSVIIPVFNTEKYLHECLESVLNQANADVEVICINDGSYDESLTIIEEYYGKHDNISVVSGKNEGPSAARNAGLQLARGKYVLFVDSDDMIQTDCINRLVAIAEEKELDFVSFDADGFYDPTEELSVAARSMLDIYHRSACDKHVYTGVEMLCEQTKVHEYIASACLLFLRKSWIEEKHLRFEIGILHEDNPFVFACYLNASRCIHTQFNGYLRRIRGGSIMTGVKSINHLRGYFTAYLLMAAEARRVGVMDENHYEVQYRIKAAFDNAQALYTQLVDEKRFVPRTSFDFVMEGLLNSATPQCSEGKQDELFTFENDENHQKRRGKRAAYDLGKVPALPNMTDLNSVVKAGTYLVLHNKQDKIVGNCPTGGTYKLVVDVLTNNVLRQTLIAGNSYNMFVRSFAFGNWTEWKNIACKGADGADKEQNTASLQPSLITRVARKAKRVLRSIIQRC